jgi:hypothetical protein
LLALDFAGELVDVVAQPFRLRFATKAGWREHTPDYLVVTQGSRWLFDVRPAERIGVDDRVCLPRLVRRRWHRAGTTGW